MSTAQQDGEPFSTTVIFDATPNPLPTEIESIGKDPSEHWECKIEYAAVDVAAMHISLPNLVVTEVYRSGKLFYRQEVRISHIEINKPIATHVFSIDAQLAGLVEDLDSKKFVSISN